VEQPAQLHHDLQEPFVLVSSSSVRAVSLAMRPCMTYAACWTVASDLHSIFALTAVQHLQQHALAFHHVMPAVVQLGCQCWLAPHPLQLLPGSCPTQP
jgi:hypothetical protein